MNANAPTLTENVRIPLHELQADVDYLIGRVAADGSCAAMIASSIKTKLAAVEAAIVTGTPAQPQPELPLSGEGTRCFLCQGDTNPDQYGEMKMIKQHVEQPEATEPMGICDCGFTADECGTNHCMRKKIHLAGMTPGSKWPEGIHPSPGTPSG